MYERLRRCVVRVLRSTLQRRRRILDSVCWHVDGPKLECFSKVYHDESNPKSDFCAVMTCSQADKLCPIVQGASKRISLPYDDPKVFDGTPQEAGKYDERCRQIAREILFTFSEAAKSNR
jgi:arsenate reductase (thioredoxin)